MAKEYLDKTGLAYFWGKIKDYVSNQISAIGALTGVKGNAETTYRTGNVNLTPANLGVKVYCTETGTSNGWHYKKYSDGYGEAWYYTTETLTHYITINGFYGYSAPQLALPFTMASYNYQVDATWQIGTGFAMSASQRRSTTYLLNNFALASASGSQTCYIFVHIYGKLA